MSLWPIARASGRPARRTLLAVLLCAAAIAAAQDHSVLLWSKSDKKCGPEEQLPEARRCVVVDADPARIRPETPRLVAWLPEKDEPLVLSRRRAAVNANGFVWDGLAAGRGSGTLSIFDKAIVGDFMSRDGKLYRLRYAVTQRYVVEEIDPSKLPREEPPMRQGLKEPGALPPSPVPAPPPPTQAAAPCTTDSPRRIDVMVLYTLTAIAANTNEAHMKARVQQAVEETNWAFDDSGVDVQLRAVHRGKIAYVNEHLGLSRTLQILTVPAEAGTDEQTLDSVHALRDSVAADIVVLIVRMPAFKGGLSNPMYGSDVGSGHASQAFAVVTESGLTLTGEYFFAHEVGHLMGSNHEWSATSDGAFADSHGHTEPTPRFGCPGWRTIVTQDVPCSGCDWLRRWSNPLQSHCGAALGVVGKENNARSLGVTRGVVANFRCGSASPNNVWIKDTWDDTGAEPDPAQASAAMWLSPYIWVRRSQDTGLEHQHDHENPISAQPAWAYVKLHNGGPATSGTLELYAANAATTLTWTRDWTLVGTQAVATFGGNSTIVAEIPWASPPGSGHHCLLARWNSSSDSMTEGPDIEPNVRGSNNIAWRNLNIIDLTRSAIAAADLRVARSGARVRSEIEVRAPPNLEGRSFLEFGQVVAKWVPNGAGTGEPRAASSGAVQVAGKSSWIADKQSTSVRGLQFAGEAPARLYLTFRRPSAKPYPMGVFRIDVVQTSQLGEGRRAVVGGVSYEVRIGKPRYSASK